MTRDLDRHVPGWRDWIRQASSIAELRDVTSRLLSAYQHEDDAYDQITAELARRWLQLLDSDQENESE